MSGGLFGPIVEAMYERILRDAVKSNEIMERLTYGNETDEERDARRRANREAAEAESKRIDSDHEWLIFRLAQGGHKVGSVLHDLAEMHGPKGAGRYRHCEGCDWGGYEPDCPEFPCATYQRIRKDYA